MTSGVKAALDKPEELKEEWEDHCACPDGYAGAEDFEELDMADDLDTDNDDEEAGAMNFVDTWEDNDSHSNDDLHRDDDSYIDDDRHDHPAWHSDDDLHRDDDSHSDDDRHGHPAWHSDDDSHGHPAWLCDPSAPPGQPPHCADWARRLKWRRRLVGAAGPA